MTHEFSFKIWRINFHISHNSPRSKCVQVKGVSQPFLILVISDSGNHRGIVRAELNRRIVDFCANFFPSLTHRFPQLTVRCDASRQGNRFEVLRFRCSDSFPDKHIHNRCLKTRCDVHVIGGNVPAAFAFSTKKRTAVLIPLKLNW